MGSRDNFSNPTKERLAKRAGCICANPTCKKPTYFAKLGDDGFVNSGIAAHITSAAPDGPRYDPNLTSEERRNQANGIWLCILCAKVIDSDVKHYTVEMLREWKKTAELTTIRALYFPIEDVQLKPELSQLEKFNQLLIPAQKDLHTFMNSQKLPYNTIKLNLKMINENNLPSSNFNVSQLATIIETFNEITISASPGTGKTTTLLQATETILTSGNSIAIYIPLNEWSSQPERLFQSILLRDSFTKIKEEQLRSLARNGQLVLILDGWNELDPESRKRAKSEINSLKRDFQDLSIIMSTRRQPLSVPISGLTIEIDGLSQSQQLDIAQDIRGLEGKAILEKAWLTPGISELITIPLYLTSLLTYIGSNEIFPKTKEELLSLFVTKNETSTDKTDILRETLYGFHKKFLIELAAEITFKEKTIIFEDEARFLVKKITDRLSNDGQISTSLQPMIVIDTLVNHHLLVRSAMDSKNLFFQHQQFQEWYASFKVEELLLASLSGNLNAKRKLRISILNQRIWEEPILFACERLSRSDGLQAIAELILDTIAIDPMLAAEMIYRASEELWERIKEKIINFVKRWHKPGTIDRAVHFMIRTGRSDFSSQIWELISNKDDQIHLATIRTVKSFHPSVLGTNVATSIAELPEELRINIISEIAYRSGIDGIELATNLAQKDVSPKVQAAVIQALQFRHADRFISKILNKASDEVWQLIAQTGYTEGIIEPDLLARFNLEQRRYIESIIDPLKKAHIILNRRPIEPSFGYELSSLIKSVDFPVKERNASWIIDEGYKFYPNEIASALLFRLESGSEIPFHTENLLLASNITIDEGPLVALVIQSNNNEKTVGSVINILGPLTVGKLLDKLILINTKLITEKEDTDKKTWEEHRLLSNWISRTNLIFFIQAILDRSSAATIDEILLFMDLIVRHGDQIEKSTMDIPNDLYESMFFLINKWVKILLDSPTSTRLQLAKIAQVIARLPSSKFVPVLKQLLAEDLLRWDREREIRKSFGRGSHHRSDAYISCTNQYKHAFSAIGDDHVIEVMKSYLPDLNFGFDAACVLKDIWDRRHNFSKNNKIIQLHDFFAEYKARQIEKKEQNESSPVGEAIFNVIAELIKPNSGDESHHHALKLAKIAFSMPYRNKYEAITKLIKLPKNSDEKKDLLMILIMAGEIVSADMILEDIQSLLENAKTKVWLLDHTVLDAWLSLLPFSDRPRATLDALALLEPNQTQPWQLPRLLSALSTALTDEAEYILFQLAEQDQRYLESYEWFNTIGKRGTISSMHLLLDLICKVNLIKNRNHVNNLTLSQYLGKTMLVDGDFRSEVYQRYKDLPAGSTKSILERAIVDTANLEGIFVLLHSYSIQNKPFDYALSSAIKNISISKHPSNTFIGAFELFSVPIPELRNKLFEIIKDGKSDAKLAVDCLTYIDEIRDEYGSPISEPRHPDIDSNLPWPLEAR